MIGLSNAQVVDGKAIAKQIKDEVKTKVDEIRAAGRRPPHLTVILVGEDPASTIYVNNKVKACRYTGDATTTICHRYTPADQLAVFTRTADIIVTAAGVPGLVTGDMVKEGVVVIDVGINRVDDPRRPGKTRLVGDVDFAGVSEKASVITPVPGGVGPCTVAMLMKNTLLAYKKAITLPSQPLQQ
ncbi:hypothetical protein ACOMHN_015825 [Nucella lapillus]